jgi:hypothetical protein
MVKNTQLVDTLFLMISTKPKIQISDGIRPSEL